MVWLPQSPELSADAASPRRWGTVSFAPVWGVLGMSDLSLRSAPAWQYLQGALARLYSQLGFRVHPPTPLKGGFLALCFPSQLCRKCALHSKTELKWITVGLWVLAACAGRSTRSKGSQQTLRLSHPVRVARKPAKNDFSRFGSPARTRLGRRVLKGLEGPLKGSRNWRGQDCELRGLECSRDCLKADDKAGRRGLVAKPLRAPTLPSRFVGQLGKTPVDVARLTPLSVNRGVFFVGRFAVEKRPTGSFHRAHGAEVTRLSTWRLPRTTRRWRGWSRVRTSRRRTTVARASGG